MSDSAATSTDLAIRIHAVETEVAAVKKAIQSTASTRRMILLLLLLFVVGVSLLFYQLVRRVQAPEFREAALAHAQRHLERNSDTYSGEMQRLVEAATPVLTEAIKQQAQRDAQRYSVVIAEERQKLLDKLEPQLKEAVYARYESGLSGLDILLTTEFPEAKDPVVQQRLHNSLGEILNEMIRDYYLDEMRGLVKGAVEKWDAFPAAEPPAAGEPTAVSQLIGCLMEILTRRLTDPDPGAQLTQSPPTPSN